MSFSGRLIALLLCPFAAGFGQLLPDQKLIDFQQLAALFSKRYAFYEWKQTVIPYDSLDLAPWIARIKESKTDLDFFEICAEYVARNQDGHTGFYLPSEFTASLPFSADLYDGVIRIDWIDRKALPAADFPFEIGDEFVSIDGVPAADAARALRRFIGDGNARSIDRDAVDLLTYRPQYLIPRAHEVGDNAVIAIRGQNGAPGTFVMSWKKSGVPYTHAGPSPLPRVSARTAQHARPAEPPRPEYLKRLRSYQNFYIPKPRFEVGYGALRPVFDMPEGFVQRLGTRDYDSLFTGTYQASNLWLGFMRVPEFSYLSSRDLQTEINYFEANTDGLIIDMTRNPGGSGCTTEQLLSYLNPGGFNSLGNSARVTWDMLEGLRSDLDSATEYEASDEEIEAIKNMISSATAAFEENRGFTAPLPLCGPSLSVAPAKDKSGKEITYSKPIMVLTDELTASAAEIFAAVMQDEHRALLYGMRTDGAGGAVFDFSVGFYMEAGTSLAQTKLIRKNTIRTPDYPAADLIENIGVRPDVISDYMTLDNLLHKGKPFVDGFTSAMVAYIQSKQQ